MKATTPIPRFRCIAASILALRRHTLFFAGGRAVIFHEALMDSDQSREADRGGRFERPVLYYVFMVPAIVGFWIVGGISIFYYFKGYCSLFTCLDQVPYWHNLVWLVFLAILAKWFARWRKPRPPAAS
jgi:hypothetical protein